jgi:hypothetical protein
MDLFYIGADLIMFAATCGLLKLCEWLSGHDAGGRS